MDSRPGNDRKGEDTGRMVPEAASVSAGPRSQIEGNGNPRAGDAEHHASWRAATSSTESRWITVPSR